MKTLATPARASAGMSSSGMMPLPKTISSPPAPLAQLLDHGGKEGLVRAGEDRERVYFTSLIVPVPQSGHEVVAPNPR